jgi:transcriptional regulator with XRE-family HTH domain
VEPREQFAANLKGLRRRSKISQEELGAAASLHRTEIGLLERSKRDPRLPTIVKLARALGVPAAELLAEIE